MSTVMTQTCYDEIMQRYEWYIKGNEDSIKSVERDMQNINFEKDQTRAAIAAALFIMGIAGFLYITGQKKGTFTGTKTFLVLSGLLSAVAFVSLFKTRSGLERTLEHLTQKNAQLREEKANFAIGKTIVRG